MIHIRILFNKVKADIAQDVKIINDVKYNLNFWPKTIENSKLISWLNYYDLIRNTEENEKLKNNSEIRKILKGMDENSNPLLIV